MENLRKSSMEVSFSSEVGVSRWDYLNLLVLRPALAIAFILFLIFLGNFSLSDQIHLFLFIYLFFSYFS